MKDATCKRRTQTYMIYQCLFPLTLSVFCLGRHRQVREITCCRLAIKISNYRLNLAISGNLYVTLKIYRERKCETGSKDYLFTKIREKMVLTSEELLSLPTTSLVICMRCSW